MVRSLLLAVLLALTGLGLGAWYWPALPPSLATHWGLDGQPNGWMPRAYGILVAPALSLLVPLLITGLTKLDPRKENAQANEPVVAAFSALMATFGLGLQVLILDAGARHDQRMSMPLTGALFALLFLGVGIILPRVQPNFFMGVRTPWTLSSDAVWRKTHRLAGWCFVAAGLVTLAVSQLSPVRIWLGLGLAMALAVLPPLVASWLYWKKEQQPA